jgi:hypothetical protein
MLCMVTYSFGGFLGMLCMVTCHSGVFWACNALSHTFSVRSGHVMHCHMLFSVGFWACNTLVHTGHVCLSGLEPSTSMFCAAALSHIGASVAITCCGQHMFWACTILEQLLLLVLEQHNGAAIFVTATVI